MNYSKTDPLNIDTDNDGINDGNELDLGLNPLKNDSKGDGIIDGNRILSYTTNDSELGVTIDIVGKGNIATTMIDVYDNNIFSNNQGLLNKIYNFSTAGIINNATIQIKYNDYDIIEKELNEDNLTLYYFNEETKELEPVKTIADKESNLLTAQLTHFSRYIIGDNTKVNIKQSAKIMFVIDNSVSMYSEQQLSDAGYTSTGAVGNDTGFKRLKLTNKLVDMFTGNYEFGVAEFSGNYVNLTEFNSNREIIKKSVNSMESNWKSNTTGTNIISALKNEISEFSNDESNHYLILLTDGKNTEGSLSSYKENIINLANDYNVKVCVIGLGNQTDSTYLNDIANATGCEFYSASDSTALDEIYAILAADINYNLVDTDNDNIVDGTIINDSGFIVTKDGFSFSNFRSNKSFGGNCYGMALFAMLYYRDMLPEKLGELTAGAWYFLTYNEGHSDGYDLTNTYFSSGKDLYDYKITDEGLSILLENYPSDYRDQIKDNIWYISEKYQNILKNIGATFSLMNYNGSNSNISQYQLALLNVDNELLNNNVIKDESQLMNAIWRLFIEQHDDEEISFLTNPDEAFESLKSSLSEKNPLVISVSNPKIGGHAINAIRLIQDLNDANKFKIEVYDNNSPGEIRYIEVVRKKYSKWQLNIVAWTNEYEYTFNYDIDGNGIVEDVNVVLTYPKI